MNYGALPLTDIAKRIDAHLKRFERDPGINKKKMGNYGMTQEYWRVAVWRAGAYVQVRYSSPVGNHASLTRSAAIRYLAWLDAGNVGTHYQVPEGFTVEIKEEERHG